MITPRMMFFATVSTEPTVVTTPPIMPCMVGRRSVVAQFLIQSSMLEKALFT